MFPSLRFFFSSFYLDIAAKSLGRCKISLKRRSRGSTHSNSRRPVHPRRCRRARKEFCRVPALARCPRSFHPHLDLQTFICGFSLEFVCGNACKIKQRVRRRVYFFSMMINTSSLNPNGVICSPYVCLEYSVCAVNYSYSASKSLFIQRLGKS